MVLGFLTSLKGQPWGEFGLGAREESLPHYPEGREMMTPCAMFVLRKDVTGNTGMGASNLGQMREKDNWEVFWDLSPNKARITTDRKWEGTAAKGSRVYKDAESGENLECWGNFRAREDGRDVVGNADSVQTPEFGRVRVSTAISTPRTVSTRLRWAGLGRGTY